MVHPPRGWAPSSCRRPIKLLDEELPVPTKAPTVGQHTDEVLHDVLGYDDEVVAALRRSGALG